MTPAAGVSGPACWIRSAGFLIDPGTLLANGDCRSVMSLNGCHELDAAVAVPVVVPVDERDDPLTGLDLAAKRPAGVIGSVLECSEQRFLVRVVV